MDLREKISSSPYLSGYTFIYEFCDHVLLTLGETSYMNELKLRRELKAENVKSGDIIFIKTEFILYFFKEIAPNIKFPYKIITGRSDNIINEKNLKFLDDHNLIKWYAINLGISHPKLVSIPLGLANLNWVYDGNVQADFKLLEKIKNLSIEKTNDILMSFRIETNAFVRKPIYEYFRNKDFISVRNFQDNDRSDAFFVIDYLKEIKSNKFVICPWGNGIDCHRIWETLYMGSIPIVQNHIVFKDYQDLPIWFINNWNEVTKEALDRKYIEISNKNYNLDLLYLDYWKEKIL